jgi:serine/threonine-protein kinase ULK/ATG1
MRTQLTHADRIMDCIKMRETFVFEDEKQQHFNFKQYYEEDSKIEIEKLHKKVLFKMDGQE